MAKLFVRVIRAHHLPVSDLFNESDPFLEVEVNGHKKKTSVIKNTLNPVWDETIVFNLKGLTLQNLYPSIINTSTLYGQTTKSKKSNTIEFTIFDHDRMSRNDKIGTCFLPLSCIYDGCPAELEDDFENGPPWWLGLSESQSIVQDYYNLKNIPPTEALKPTFHPEILNFDDEKEEIEYGPPSLQSFKHQENLTQSTYSEESWLKLWKSPKYKQAMYDQKKKPKYIELEIQLEPQFIDNRLTDREYTKPLLIIETLLTNVSIGKTALKKSGPSVVPPTYVSPNIEESYTNPGRKSSPQIVEKEKHLPRLSLSRLSRTFRLKNSPSSPESETK